MGWTYQHRDKGQSNDEWFAREFPETLTLAGQVLASATVGGVYYAAVRKRDTGETWALVVLTQWVRGDWHNFGYKEMDETMGPSEDRCPARVLDLLTPTDSEYANQWRERCRARLERAAARPKVKKGDRVRFAQPITFSNGDVVDTFTFVERSTFRSADGLMRLYRITGWRDRTYEVIR